MTGIISSAEGCGLMSDRGETIVGTGESLDCV